MKRGKALNSNELKCVETLVGWKTKLKIIAVLVGNKEAVSAAKRLYRQIGLSAPNGMPGAAIAERKSHFVCRSFVSLANSFLRLRREGVKSSDAMISVFSSHDRAKKLPVEKCNANTWFSLARELDTGVAGVYRCRVCDGGHLWQFGVSRFHKKCIWCKSRLEMPDAAVEAANMGLSCSQKQTKRQRQIMLF